MKKLLYLALLTLTAVLPGCSEDEPSQPTPLSGMEIMTIIDNNPLLLEMQRRSDASPIQMSTSQRLSDDLPAGTRIVVVYRAEVADTSLRPVPITVSQVGVIPFDTIQALSKAQIQTLPPARTEVLSQWVTGNFINFQALLNFDGEPRGFTLVADKTTLQADTLQLYMTCTGPEPSSNFVERRTYGSFFTGKVFSRPDRPFKIHIIE